MDIDLTILVPSWKDDVKKDGLKNNMENDILDVLKEDDGKSYSSEGIAKTEDPTFAIVVSNTKTHAKVALV